VTLLRRGLQPGGTGSAIDITQLDDFEKKVLEILKEYLQGIKDYRSAQQQGNPSKGGGPSLFDWEWEEMILAGLPTCFESYKNKLADIENRIIDYTSSTEKIKGFVKSLKEKITSTSNDEQVRDSICKTLTEGLSAQAPSNLKITLSVDKTPATYLPIKNDPIKATATINTPADSCEVKFILVKASDFTFKDKTITPKTISLTGNSIDAELVSTSYGSVVTLRAVLIRNGHKLDSAQLQLPIDTDGDQMADVWELDPVNGGTLSLGKNNQKDRDWDEEKSRGNSNDGDGYTKWDEYLGTVINGAHARLKPTRKEVFFDTSLAGEGAFVKQEFQTQLDVDVFEIGGAGFVMAGTKVPNKVELKDKINYSQTDNGLIYVSSQRTTNTEYPHYGNTSVTAGTYNGGRSEIYTGTMANIWLNNSFKESKSYKVNYKITDINGDRDYYAVFDGTDINGDGDTTDIINPFDLLAPSQSAFKSNTKADNDPIDGLIATISQQQKHRNTSLHEAGHAVGIVPNNNGHPTSGQSVMRSGIGPGQIPTFTPAQIKQMNLKP
jgi:hypothetical protein